MSSESDVSASSFSSFPSEDEEESKESGSEVDADDVSRRSGTVPKKARNSVRGSNITTPGVNIPKQPKTGKMIIYAPAPGEEDYRRSTRYMTPFEAARLIGERADMISRNEPIHPKYRNMPTSDLIIISKTELFDRDIPFPLRFRRPIDKPNFVEAKIIEVFNPREMILPNEADVAFIMDYLPQSSWTVESQLD